MTFIYTTMLRSSDGDVWLAVRKELQKPDLDRSEMGQSQPDFLGDDSNGADSLRFLLLPLDWPVISHIVARTSLATQESWTLSLSHPLCDW